MKLIRKIEKWRRTFFLLFNIVLFTNLLNAATYFVNSSASINGTGLSWNSPKTTITAAISASSAGDVILVKYGTYAVSSAIVLTSNRKLTSDDGNGTGWDDANPDSSLCIIAGNNTKRIFYMTGTNVTNETRIRGFKITGGNATTESTMITAGGGMLLLYGASPIIENCWITDNVAASTNQNVQSSGGGICSWYAGSNPIIRFNYFNNNIALKNSGSSAGGAIYATVGSVPEIYGNTFKNNKAAVGSGDDIYPNYAGAVYVYDGTPKIYNNIFEGNIALERTTSWNNAPWGAIVGAGAIETGTNCNAMIVNNLFKNNISLNCPNSSTYTGTGTVTSAGAVSATASSVIMNNTFVGNSSRSSYAYNATGSAGGLKNYSSNATVKNNIFVDHSSYNGAAFMGGTITISNNAFYNNGVNYTGNGTMTSLNEINANPQFVAASGGNYQLSETSPCVNAGDPNTDITAFPVDLTNNNRKKGGTIDIGAYEYQSDDPPFITSAAAVVVTEDVYFSYHIVAEDDTGTELILSVDNLPVWLHADADSVFGVATEGAVDTSFRIIASDGTLSDTSLVSVDVVLIDDLPVISEIFDIEIYQGDVIPPVAFLVFDEETALDELQVTIFSSVGFLVPVDSISISGSGTNRIIDLKPVSGKIGTCDITIQLNDGSQTVIEQFRVTILKPNSAPSIKGTPLVSVFENTLYYFGFKITDSDGDPVSFSATYPDWLSLDSAIAAMSIIAGTGVSEFNGNEKPATSAAIGSVQDVAVDQDGNIYIVESSNYRVCKITPDGIIHDFAGNGTYGNSGDDGLAVNAQFKSIFAVAVDRVGNVYIADASDNRIRVVSTDGVISHFAGTAGVSDFAGDGDAAANAKFSTPRDIFIDSEENIYIADSGNNRIRKIDRNGIITTVAGSGYSSFGGDGGPAVNAYLKLPTGVCLDTNGNMFIADMWNNRVRKVDTNGIISTFAGNGAYSSTGDGGLAVEASMYYPQGVVADNDGNVFVSVQQSKNVRKINSDGIISTAVGSGSGDFGSISLSSPNGLCIDG
ncbi:MAG: hypothetical protein JXR87_05590, partial [Candidatus Marinimicrobia bacterium]|nr:hypothetical protein [Candidatus Neomarinimicrobiota bacterium]